MYFFSTGYNVKYFRNTFPEHFVTKTLLLTKQCDHRELGAGEGTGTKREGAQTKWEARALLEKAPKGGNVLERVGN